MIVRPATDGDDRLAIGQVYVDSWRAAYRGLIPQAYLDGLDARNWLGVLKGNLRAQAFYRRQGFAPSGARLEGEVGGQPVEEIQYTRPLA